MVEAAILIALVGLAVAWAATRLPEAMKNHYDHTVRVVASPL